MARPGDVVAGRYRLERPLGRGGMGEVWAAVHTITEQRRAVKLVTRETSDAATKKRILREARAACAVRHPNVVVVHDVVEGEDGTPVLVMDLLEGETLESRLARLGKLAPHEVVRIGLGIAAGLEAAHALGIVHRDLKPANVLLTPEPVLLDFGVAKLTAESGPARATNLLTESGAMIGTPCYMAPEQAFGEGEVDARTDLWALGVVLYECLAGVRPADGATMGQVFKVLATGAIVPLATRAPEVPPDLVDLVERLLRLDPKERLATAREAHEALERIAADGERVPSTDTTPPVERPVRPEKAAPSRRRTAVLAAVAVLLAGIASASALRGAREIPRTSPPVIAAAPVPAPAPAPEPAPSSAPPAEAPAARPASSASASAKPAARKPAAPAPRPSAPAPRPAAAAIASDTKLLTDPTF